MRTVHSLPLLALACVLLSLSCKKDDPVFPNQITSDYYFQAIVDGDTFTYQEGVNEYGNIVGDFYGGTVPGGFEYAPFTCIASGDAVGNPTAANLARSGALALISVEASAVQDQNTYEGLVATGTLPIGFLSRTPVDSGFAGGYVSFFDADGTEWTSNGPQSGGTVIVNEYSDFEDTGRSPNTHKVMAAEFSCTLYDGNGNSKALTGGRVRGRFITW